MVIDPVGRGAVGGMRSPLGKNSVSVGEAVIGAVGSGEA